MSKRTQAFKKLRSHCWALVTAAFISAAFLPSTPAQATLTTVHLTQFEWAQTQVTPTPCLTTKFCVTNQLLFGAVTNPEVTTLLIAGTIDTPVGSGTLFDPLEFDGSDLDGYANWTGDVQFTFLADGPGALMGPYTATVLDFFCDITGPIASCDFTPDVPTVATFEGVAIVPEPSTFWLFISGLTLLLAIWFRPGSGLAGARHSSPSV